MKMDKPLLCSKLRLPGATGIAIEMDLKTVCLCVCVRPPFPVRSNMSSCQTSQVSLIAPSTISYMQNIKCSFLLPTAS